MNGRFIPKKRTFIDGRTWWCVWDTVRQKWSDWLYFSGRYRTKKSCMADIAKYDR